MFRMVSVPTLLAWFERRLEFRNRLLASPRFQRLATRFPPTRWIARRRARELFDLCAGFVYSQVLLACVRLHLLEILAEGPQTIAALAQRLSLSPDSTNRLLGAAASLGLVERRRNDRFGLGVLGAALLGNPAITAMVAHHPLLYADLEDPVALLRGQKDPTSLARYWPYAGHAAHATLDDAEVAAYSALMSASQPLIADQVLDSHPIHTHRTLLDVGGGEGAFVAAAAARAPSLRVILFDLPAVAARARARFDATGLSARATAVGGDFFSDPLPTGADVVSLIRVVHDHDDDRVLVLLRAVRRSLAAGGVLLLAEPMSATAGAERIGEAYFAFYLLAMGSGRARTASELEGLLRAAGFDDVRRVETRMPLQTGLLVARVGTAALRSKGAPAAPAT